MTPRSAKAQGSPHLSRDPAATWVPTAAQPPERPVSGHTVVSGPARRSFIPRRSQALVTPSRSGTFRAHRVAIYPELMRSTETSAAGQTTSAVRSPWSERRLHRTRPTGRLTPHRALTCSAYASSRCPKSASCSPTSSRPRRSRRLARGSEPARCRTRRCR